MTTGRRSAASGITIFSFAQDSALPLRKAGIWGTPAFHTLGGHYKRFENGRVVRQHHLGRAGARPSRAFRGENQLRRL